MDRTKRTLSQQMSIDRIEITNRMKILDLGESEIQLLVGCKGFIRANIDSIVSEFYEIQTAIDEVSLLIGDLDSMKKLKTAMKGYVLDLFSGHYDEEYVNNRLRIGLIHKRIGVGPKLYFSALHTLKSVLVKYIRKNMREPALSLKIEETLDKFLYFDITLVFDTYIRSLVSEVEAAKQRAESYARSLEEKIAERTTELEALSRKDSLTKLYNVRSLHEYLRRAINNAKRNGTSVCLVFIDVDSFKTINDEHGHSRGDEVLRNVSISLSRVIREVDIPCRYGGDEFCVILPECEEAGAEEIFQRFLEEFSQLEKDISLSFGIAQTGPETYFQPDDLIHRADKKMYKSKDEEGSKNGQ